MVGGHPIPTNRALGRAIDPRTLTQIDGPKTAVEEVRRYRSEYKVATIKTIMESGGVLGYPRMSVETLKALADEAHKLRLKVYAHAIQLPDIKDSLNGGVDLVAHGLVEALTPESDIAQLMSKNKVSWLPDLNNSEAAIKLFDHPEIFNDPQVRKSVPGRYIDMARDPKVLASMRPRLEGSRVRFESSRKTVKVLYDLGVNILVGTDSTGAPHRMFFGWDLHREMELLVEAGMKPMDVVVAASRKAAEYLGQEKELGTIEPGKKADLIILSKNPLENIRNTRRIEQVIYAGRIIDRDNIPMLDPFKEGLAATGREPRSRRPQSGSNFSGPVSARSSQGDGFAAVLDLSQPQCAFEQTANRTRVGDRNFRNARRKRSGWRNDRQVSHGPLREMTFICG